MRPQAIVALDAAAAKSLLGLAATITRLRDNPSRLEDGTTVCVTIHRSFLLRMLDRARAARERAAFAQDLAAIRDHMETVARASVTLDSASAGP